MIIVSAQLPRDKQEKTVVKPTIQLRKLSPSQRWHNLNEIRVLKMSIFSALRRPNWPPTTPPKVWVEFEIKATFSFPTAEQNHVCVTDLHMTLPYKLESALCLVQSRDSIQFWRMSELLSERKAWSEDKKVLLGPEAWSRCLVAESRRQADKIASGSNKNSILFIHSHVAYSMGKNLLTGPRAEPLISMIMSGVFPNRVHMAQSWTQKKTVKHT